MLVVQEVTPQPHMIHKIDLQVVWGYHTVHKMLLGHWQALLTFLMTLVCAGSTYGWTAGHLSSSRNREEHY